jgi:hypothetical protein
MHAQSTNDSSGPGSLYREYTVYQKTYMYVLYVCELPYPIPPVQNYITEISCMRNHWHRIPENRRIRSWIKKGFIPWIRGLGEFFDIKKPKVENRDTVILIVHLILISAKMVTIRTPITDNAMYLYNQCSIYATLILINPIIAWKSLLNMRPKHVWRSAHW